MKALSLRQPWAWLVVNGYKDIENRSWPTKRRERIYIHASAKKVTKKDYEEFLEICRKRRINSYPEREKFVIGGIVGSVEIINCVERSKSFWFYGPYGFVLKGARKLPFKAIKGKLKLFEVKKSSYP